MLLDHESGLLSRGFRLFMVVAHQVAAGRFRFAAGAASHAQVSGR